MDPRFLMPVDLWLISLGQDATVSPADLGDAQDRRRCEQILVPGRRRQFAFRRQSLRYVLSRYLPRFSLAFEKNGKPYVRTSSGRGGLRFSTSSSRDVCAVCVCHEGETGVDVEAHPPSVDLAGVVRQFLSAAVDGGAVEADAAAAALPKNFRQHLAVMSWCRLEAHTKLHGRTLHEVLFEAPNTLLPQAFSGRTHHAVAVANLEHVCVIAQKEPFHVARVHQLDFSRIAHEQA